MISVVVPVYNAMEYIGECLASLERQSDPSFEVILVDDGSTDGSSAFCDDYAAKRDNIKVVHQKNGGQQAARAAGIRGAAGDYVAFLDSDDCLRLDAIMRISKTLEDERPDIVCFDFSRGEIETYKEGALRDKVLAPGVYRGSNYASVHAALCSGDFNNLCTKVVRRDLAIDALALLDECSSLRHAEDLYFLIQIVRKAESLFCLSDVLYFYRRNTASVTSAFAPSQISDLIYVFSALVECSSEWGREYVMLSKEAAIKHLLWSLMSLADSNYSAKEKIGHADFIAKGIVDVCGEDASAATAELRLDFKIPIRLLLAGHKRLALVFSSMISRLAKMTIR